MDAERAAMAHGDMFRFHDEQDWPRFRRTVVDYLVALGYDVTRARKAAKHVTEAYKQADIAATAQANGNQALEDSAYARSLGYFIAAHRALGIETTSPKYKVRWYWASRHKKRARIVWNLFMENLSKLGWKRLLLVLQLTFISIVRVYPAHNNHDWPALYQAFKEYWTVAASAYTDKFPAEL